MKNRLKVSLRAADRLIAAVSARLISRIESFSGKYRVKTSEDKRKIYIDCSYLYATGINTGIQRVVRNILLHFDDLSRENGMESVPVALVNGTFLRLDSDALLEYRAGGRYGRTVGRIGRKLGLFFSSFAAGEKLSRGDIVLMLDSSWYMPVWPSVERAKREGAVIVGVTYDLIPISHPEFCDDTLRSVFAQWYENAAKYFDGFISISKSVEAELKEYLLSRGIAAQKYFFDSFVLGSDFVKKDIDRGKIREELADLFRDSRSVYITVSTIEPRKNHRMILEAFERLWSDGMDVKWVIIGKDGWKMDDFISQLLREDYYEETVFRFSDLSDEELLYAYSRAKALIFASIVEGYGLPIVEALSSGLPVLCSDTPVHREVGGDKVLYFDAQNAQSLYRLIEGVENGAIELKKPDSSSPSLPDWRDSSEELFEKVLETAERKSGGKSDG